MSKIPEIENELNKLVEFVTQEAKVLKEENEKVQLPSEQEVRETVTEQFYSHLNSMQESLYRRIPDHFIKVIEKPAFAEAQSIHTSKKGVLLSGNSGTGKSFQAYSIFSAMSLLLIKFNTLKDYDMNTGRYSVEIKKDDFYEPCRFFSSPLTFFDISIYKHRFDEYGQTKLQSLFRGMQYSYFIVIDDLGAEIDNEENRSIISTLIDYRYSNNLLTVITTNLTFVELAQRYGDRTASRLFEMCRIVELKGLDKRLSS